MNPENTLCLVVDVQERLLSVLHGTDGVVGRCCTPLRGMRALDVPLLATEQYPKGLGKIVPAVQLLLGGAPVSEEIRFSTCLPQVGGILKQKRIANVVLAGAETYICMLQTVSDLRAAGLEVYVPFDYTASRHPGNKENGLQQTHDAGVVVSSIKSLLFMLLGDVGHPAFKVMSKSVQQWRRAKIVGLFTRIEISDGLPGMKHIGEAA